MEEMKACYDLETAGRATLRQIEYAFMVLGIQNSCYAFKGRVKSADDIRKKVKRKMEIEKKSDYTVFNVTDIVGLRILTLFRADALNIVSILMDIISHRKLETGNPIYKNSLLEGYVYSPHKTSDTIGKGVMALIENYKISAAKLDVLESGPRYSSIHLVCQSGLALAGDFPEDYRLPIEIQVRTVFEDAWGEIDHKYGYANRRESAEPETSQSNYVTSQHLRVLKQYVDACVSYADLIAEQALTSEGKKDTTGSVNAVDRNDNEILILMRTVHVPDELISIYAEIKRLRKTALDNVKKGTGSAESLINPVAEKFLLLERNAAEKRGTNLLEQRPYDVYRYFILMARAFCLLSMDNITAFKEAGAIYQELLVDFPRNPLLYFRLGQSWARAGVSSLAIKEYKQAVRIIDAGDEWLDENTKQVLCESDLDFLKLKAHKLLGYEYWVASKNLNTEISSYIEHKLAHLKLAYQTTKRGIERIGAEDHAGLLNNLLFYALEYVEFVKLHSISGTKAAKITNKEIKDLLKAMEKQIDIKTTTDVHYLDTYVYAQKVLGTPKAAKNAAKRILKLLLGDDRTGGTGNLTEAETAIVRRAYEALDVM